MFEIIQHGTPAYQKTVALRDAVLRRPLGMVFSAEQLAEEHDQVHIAHFDFLTGEALACLILQKSSQFPEQVKMRQVAVAPHLQRQGIGSKMCAFAEAFARQQGYQKMYCHARDSAVPFYQKRGYQIFGEAFEEVGIKHFAMAKQLA